MRLGQLLSSAQSGTLSTPYFCAMSIYRALDGFGRSLGVLMVAESRNPALIRLYRGGGTEYGTSCRALRRHEVLMPWGNVVNAGVLRFYWGAKYAQIRYNFNTVATLGYYQAQTAKAWPWRYYWGDTCPAKVTGVTDWATVLATSGLPPIKINATDADCLFWEGSDGEPYILPVFFAERGGSNGGVTDTYVTPPLLPSEQRALLTLCEGARAIFKGLNVKALPLAGQGLTAGQDEKQVKILMSYAVN